MKTGSRIVITGFMAAGKTAVAEALARLTGGRMIDLDRELVESEGCSIRQFIEENGETLFREAETLCLQKVLEDKTASVIALGGGAWTVKLNRAIIAEQGCRTVWLDAPFELCWQRIMDEENGDTRPLACDYARTKRLYEERRSLYALANHCVETIEGMTAEAVASEIFARCKEKANGKQRI